jgi:integrase
MSRRPQGIFRDPRNGRWGYVFTSAHPRADGRRRQVRRGGLATMEAAKEARAAAVRDDRGLLVAGEDGFTVGAVLEQYVRTKRLQGRAPATVHQVEWATRRLIERFGRIAADRLTADHLDELYLDLMGKGRRVHKRGKGVEETERPLAARTVLIVHKVAKAAFALAVDKGQLVRNPARLATPPATDSTKVEARPHWAPDQVGDFLRFIAERRAKPRKVDTPERHRLPVGIIETLVDTGGRRGEALALRWSDIDLEGGTATIVRQLAAHPGTKAVEVRPPKRPRSKATVALHPSTIDVLKARRREQAADRLRMGAGWPTSGVAADLVFTWPDGSPIHPDVLTRSVARLSVEAGLPRLTAHGLRHSFATAALAARVPVEVVAARLGNTARVVQETYAHVIPADDHAAAQIVGDLYRASGSASS